MKVIASFDRSQKAYAPEYNDEPEMTAETTSPAVKRTVAYRRGCIAKCKNGKKSVRRAKKDFTADASFQDWIENDVPVMPVDKVTEVLDVASMTASHEHFPTVAIAEEPQGVTRGGSEGASSDSAETLSSGVARGGSEGASSDSAGISAEQLGTSLECGECKGCGAECMSCVRNRAIVECEDLQLVDSGMGHMLIQGDFSGHGMFDWHALDVEESEVIDLSKMFPPGLADDDEEE